MTSWFPIPRYCDWGTFIVTLECGHQRVIGGEPPSWASVPVYECWCDRWFQRAIAICEVPQ